MNLIIDNIKTLFFALLIAMVFRSFFFEPFHIPSGSMKSTLLVGDYLFVSKYHYGYSKYSFPFSPGIFKGRKMENNSPDYGDIIVFRPPHDTKKDYIKRIVALQGDRVQMIDGFLYVNGKRLKTEHMEDYMMENPNGEDFPVERMRETLLNGKTHEVLNIKNDYHLDNTKEFIVPKDHIFVMGDNRDDSADSRAESGFTYVPIENIVGKAEIIIFSIKEGTRFWEVWKIPFALRNDRFFTLIGDD
jgi:signal peptidase I